jgi:hypothetical protein
MYFPPILPFWETLHETKVLPKQLLHYLSSHLQMVQLRAKGQTL